MFDRAPIEQILSAAYERGDHILTENYGFEILKALGFKICPAKFVHNLQEARQTEFSFTGDQVVVKVVSPGILHKSDVGGVVFCANEPREIISTIEQMTTRWRNHNLFGFTVSQFVNYDKSLGGELLLGLRRTNDFGPVVTIGAGGIYTEFLAKNFKSGCDVAILSPALSDSEKLESALNEAAIVRLVTNPPRGQQPRLQFEQIVEATNKLVWLGSEFGDLISDFEINPLVIADGELVALDVLARLSRAQQCLGDERPVHKIKRLLEPQSAAVIGVSESLNPGHLIVNNLLREGFDRSRLYIVKPHAEKIEGCRCYPEIASLPERVDLLVVSVSAAQVPQTVTQAIDSRKAEAIVVIPGGLEEKAGGCRFAAQMREALAAARKTDWRGPVINGGNCLGIRSRPGHYDTMFIPQEKLSTRNGAASISPAAIISQSGAFGLAKGDKLAFINPKYNITLGNQIDLTVGDYLSYLKDDNELDVFAVYVEGFAPLDGLKFLEAAAQIAARGGQVILYRAGRTPEGAKASSSHTASIAGDYAVTAKLAQQASVIVADTMEEFEDLVRLCLLLRNQRLNGWRLGAISNAGFECVAIADNVGTFTLPAFSERTTHRLRAIFEHARIDQLVDVHNPLDVTPMADDAAFEAAARALLEDENVDVGMVGCVPMTAALNTVTLAGQPGRGIDSQYSIVQRLVRLKRDVEKPWVAVVDGGGLYDPMVERLCDAGIPTYRSADRALKRLNSFCMQRYGRIKHSTVEEGRCEMAGLNV